MKRRFALVATALVIAVAAGGFALADTGSDDADAAPPLTVNGLDDPSTDGNQPANGEHGDEEPFVGLSKANAITLAEEQAREWRIGREDTESYALDAALRVGRITFEVDSGIVTAASIEADSPPPPPVNWGPVDIDRANVLVAGIERLVTVDNTFGGGNVFTHIRVADTITAAVDRPALHPLELELIAAALQDAAKVGFSEDAAAEIADFLASESSAGIAVVSVEDVRIEAERAELDLSMWCGSLCGTWLTYELVPTAEGWEVLGIVGPVAVS